MKRLKQATDSEWKDVNSFNKELVKNYMSDNIELSARTKETYLSNLRLWFVWVKDNLNNKRQVDIKSREYKRFQNTLAEMGHSYSDIATKRATISSLNNYILIYYEDEFPTFRNFVNSSIKMPEKVYVNEKNPPTREELNMMIDKLEESKLWDKYQKIAYLKFTFTTGCRRAETRQLLKSDVIDNDPIIRTITVKDENGNKIKKESKYYVTHEIRCKGRGKTGKIRKLKYDEETHQALLKWLEVRGDDDCPYVFVTKDINGSMRQVSPSTFNAWGAGIFTKLLGRRFHPHCLREARATDAVVEQGMEINTVRSLLGHEDIATTQIYVCRQGNEEEDDEFFV